MVTGGAIKMLRCVGRGIRWWPQGSKESLARRPVREGDVDMSIFTSNTFLETPTCNSDGIAAGAGEIMGS